MQAPKGEEGLYLGFSHLHSFISAIVGFFLSGLLLESFCPDPRTLSAADGTAASSASGRAMTWLRRRPPRGMDRTASSWFRSRGSAQT